MLLYIVTVTKQKQLLFMETIQKQLLNMETVTIIGNISRKCVIIETLPKEETVTICHLCPDCDYLFKPFDSDTTMIFVYSADNS